MSCSRNVGPFLTALVLALSACDGAPAESAEEEPESGEETLVSAADEPAGVSNFLRFEDVDWQPLNPARGDASPRAATLWGDRGGSVATGFLARFVEGFSSPPHIHNVTYRAVVIEGLVHNDDPNAEAMWMGPGSFWTQPRGAVHITSASAADNIAYVEIDSGPYLVWPPEQAVPTDEQPINVDASNLVWVAPNSLEASPLRVAYLWGDPVGTEPSGRFVRVPSGSAASLDGDGALFRAVVVRGVVDAGDAPLNPGSYLDSEGAVSLSCAGESECVLYVRGTAPKVGGA